MSNLFRLELKKFHSLNNIVIFICFLIYVAINVISLSSVDVIDSNGEFHRGILGWKILMKEANKSNGIVTEKYMFKERERYKNSIYRKYIEGTDRTDRENGWRLEYPQNLLLFTLNAPYGEDINTIYSTMNLTDSQINNFYNNWSKSVIRWLENRNVGYSQQQLESIKKKADKIDKPFTYEYNMGWQIFGIQLEKTFNMFLIFILIISTGTLSKNEIQGFNEMILATKHGRLNIYSKKIKTIILFMTIFYLIYVLFLTTLCALIYGFGGGNASLAFCTSAAIFSLKTWQVTLSQIIIGYFVLLVYSYLYFLVSLLLKKESVIIITCGLLIILVNKYGFMISNYSECFYKIIPQNFIFSPFATDKVFIVHKAVIPYGVVGLIFSIIDIFIFRILGVKILRKYYL